MVGENSYTFQWHITHKCNLRCKHCYLDEYAKEPSISELFRIIKLIEQFLDEKDAVGEIDITGGEPFVSPHIFSILNWLETSQRIRDIVIGTNGTLITEETVRQLKQYKKLRAVQISIDGNEKTHDIIRGEGNFKTSIEAIKLLSEHGIKVSVSFTANRINYKEFDEVANIVSKAGAKVIWTDRVIPLGSPEKRDELIKNMVLTNDEFKEYLSIIHTAKQKHSEVKDKRPLQFIETNDKCGHICSAGKRLLTITADNQLMPCRRLDLYLGSLKKHSISELIEAYDFKERSRIVDKIHVTPDGCKGCKHLDYCQGGSKCLTYATLGTFDAPDPNCLYVK